MPSMILHTPDFLAALKTLVPKRMTAAARSSELYIGKHAGEAVFSIKGAITRCRFVEAEWDGFAVVNLGMIVALLKAPPPTGTIIFNCNDERLKIDTLSIRATWVDSPEWIAAMVTEAHLQTIDEPKIRLYCPYCGKRKGQPTEANAPWPVGLPTTAPLTKEHANMQCAACGHLWCEVGKRA